MQSLYRTITADKLTEKLIGATVTMCGWVENIRDHGGVSFIDLRDYYGVVQVVMRDTSLLHGLVKEFYQKTNRENIAVKLVPKKTRWHMNFN